MELEFFVPPAESAQWYEYWCNERLDWYVELGIPADMLRLRPHDADELSHYSAGTSDVEFKFPWGFDELEGIAQRTDFDLKAHASTSGERLDYFDPADQRALRAVRDRAGRRRDPHDGGVPARGVRRGRDQRRDAHRAAPAPAPRAVQGRRAAAVEEGHADAARPARSARTLAERYMVDYDETQTIGKPLPPPGRDRHAAGVTVDFDSLDDNAGHDPRSRHAPSRSAFRSTTCSARVADRLGF